MVFMRSVPAMVVTELIASVSMVGEPARPAVRREEKILEVQ